MTSSVIAFARMQPFKKFATGCMGDKLNYIGRRGRYAARKDLLAGPCTILPVGAPSRFRDERRLWAEAEDKEKAGHIVAMEVLVALPSEEIMTKAEAMAFCRDLANEISLEHSLAVTFAIHADGAAEAEMEEADPAASRRLSAEGNAANRHVHMLLTSRQISAAGFAKWRYYALLPSVGGRSLSPSAVRSRAHVVDAANFQAMARRALERFVARAGKPQRLRLNAVHPAYHVGPVAAARALLNDVEALARRPDGEAIVRKAERMRVNSEIEIRNRQAVGKIAPLIEHLSDRVFTHIDIERLVSRYCDGPAEQARIVGEVMQQSLHFTASRSPGLEKFYILPRYHEREAHIAELFSRLAARSARVSNGAEGLVEQVLAGRPISLLGIANREEADALNRCIEELRQRGETVVMASHLNKRRQAPANIELLPLHWEEPPIFPAGAIVAVDEVDDISLPQLERLLEAAFVADARLLLCRRSYRQDFVPHPTLSALFVNLGSAPAPARSSGLPFELMKDRNVEFHSDIASLVRRAALYNEEAVRRGRAIFFLSADPLATNLLSKEARRGKTLIHFGSFVPPEWNGPVVVLHTGIACDGAHLVSLYALKLQFLVAENVAADIAALDAQLKYAAGRWTTLTDAVTPYFIAAPDLMDRIRQDAVDGPVAADGRPRPIRSGQRSSMQIIGLMNEDDIRPDDFDDTDHPGPDDDADNSDVYDNFDDADLSGEDDPDPDDDEDRPPEIDNDEDDVPP